MINVALRKIWTQEEVFPWAQPDLRPVLEQEGPAGAWRTTVLTSDDSLRVPEIGIEIPVAEIYEDITFSDDDASE